MPITEHDPTRPIIQKPMAPGKENHPSGIDDAARIITPARVFRRGRGRTQRRGRGRGRGRTQRRGRGRN